MQTAEFHIMSVARPKGDKPWSAVSVRKVTSYGCAFVRENSVNCTGKTQYNLLGLLLSASMLQYTTRFFSLWITEQWRFVSIITESRKRQFCMAWLVRCCRLFRAAEPTLSFNEEKIHFVCPRPHIWHFPKENPLYHPNAAIAFSLRCRTAHST